MLLILMGLLLNVTPAKAIIGGSPVEADDQIAKSTVLLYGVTSTGQGFTCTGSILNSEYILSAAHCVTDVKTMIVFFTLDGSGDKLKAVLQAKTNVRQVVSINHNIDYPNTELGSMYPHNDIGLIRFAGGIPAGYKPVTILQPNLLNTYLKLGMDVVIAGFGQRGGDESAPSGTLYKNAVKLQRFYAKTVVVGEAGSSACHGDSGGPAFISVGGKLYQFGVLSRGEAGCVSSATYTPLTSNFFGQMANPGL